MPLPQIHRSDILAFYTKLLKHGFAINSLESINTIVHPTLEMAVDDDYIRKNPSKGHLPQAQDGWQRSKAQTADRTH